MTTLVFASHTFGASILVAAFTTTFGREPGAKGEKRFIKAALKKKIKNVQQQCDRVSAGCGLTFGVGLREVRELAAVWSCGLDQIAGEDGNGSHEFFAGRVFL